MDISRAFKNNRLCKALTGMTISEIDGLLPTFADLLFIKAKSKNRKRAFGGGRKGELTTPLHKLFFILFYSPVLKFY